MADDDDFGKLMFGDPSAPKPLGVVNAAGETIALPPLGTPFTLPKLSEEEPRLFREQWERLYFGPRDSKDPKAHG
jgi:hypothetical protein